MDEHLPRVLIVEDAGHWLDFLQALLYDMKCLISVASNLEEGLARLEQGPYHLAIVDVRLEEGNVADSSGLQFIKEAWERRKVRCFFVLSGYQVEKRVRTELDPEIPYSLFDKADLLGEQLETRIRELIDEAGQHDFRRNP